MEAGSGGQWKSSRQFSDYRLYTSRFPTDWIGSFVVEIKLWKIIFVEVLTNTFNRVIAILIGEIIIPDAVDEKLGFTSVFLCDRIILVTSLRK